MTSIIYGPPKEIESLSQFVDAISQKIENNEPDTFDLQYLFRGHSSISYKLCPSIARSKVSIMLEPKLIEQACNKLPDTFNNNEDKISLLAKMQHYGLPTRLIDFTLNPLVALYFACQPTSRNNDPTGVILETNNHIYCSGKRIAANTELVFKERWRPDDLTTESNLLRAINLSYYEYSFVKALICSCIDFIPERGISVRDYIEWNKERPWFKTWADRFSFEELSDEEQEICIAALMKSPIVVEAQEQIERQRLQQGVYLLIPNKVQRDLNGDYRIYRDLPPLYHEDNRVGHYLIKSDRKKQILKDLNKIGINEGFLFCDSIDHVCAQIKKTHFRPL